MSRAASRRRRACERRSQTPHLGQGRAVWAWSSEEPYETCAAALAILKLPTEPNRTQQPTPPPGDFPCTLLVRMPVIQPGPPLHSATLCSPCLRSCSVLKIPTATCPAPRSLEGADCACWQLQGNLHHVNVGMAALDKTGRMEVHRRRTSSSTVRRSLGQYNIHSGRILPWHAVA